MTTTDINPIRAVLARLDHGRLWQKGDLGTYWDLDGPVCLRGAVYCILEERGLRGGYQRRRAMAAWEAPILAVMAEQFPDRARPPNPDRCVITWFNDHDDTDWPDIEPVLEKAADLWDSRQVQA